MKRIHAVALATTALLVVTPLFAHDFWLIPNAFRVAPGEEVVVMGQTSSDFPTTLSAVTADRVASARFLTSASERPVGSLDVSGPSLRLRHTPDGVGQAIVEVTVLPRDVPESAESFRNYLTLEGAPEALERYEQAGILPTDSIIRRYAKYAKTLVEMGSGGPRAFDRLASHPLEFVPLADPSETERGEELRFRMLFMGEPLALARGHASVAESADAPTSYHHVEFVTDEAGEFSLAIAGEGLWNVRALHIVPATSGSGADWDVHWATFVWGVPE